MATLSPGLELSIFANQIPFLEERNYRKLPAIKAGKIPEPISDIWTVLALLIERHNDQTVRKVLTSSSPTNRHGVCLVRVGMYSSGYTHEEWTRDYDFPITGHVVEELVRKRYVGGTPQWGYTDDTVLNLTERGARTLIDRINSLG